jgi:peptide/nickel transport system substrate-binding protein
MEAGADEFLTRYNDTGWLSCGPFRIESWQKGDSVRLVRNDGYWKVNPETEEPLPYLDRLTFRFFPDTAALLQAFADRAVDVMAPSETEIEAIATLRGLEGSGAEVQVVPGPIWEHVGFQFGANAAGRNAGSYNTHLNFRKAVAHAIDRQLIVDEIFGGEVGPMSSYVDAFRPEWSGGAWDQYDYDPARAREYLADLCAEEGVDCEAVPPKVVFTATLNSPARVELSQLLIPMFEEVGIAYEAELEDSLLFFGETLERGTWDVGEWSWVGQPGMAELVAWHMMLDPAGPPPLGRNYYRWGTPEVSGTEDPGLDQAAGYSDEHSARFGELWGLMRTTVDATEIQAYVAEAEALLADQVVLLPLYQRPDVGAAWADVVAGYRHTPLYLGDPASGGDTWNAGLWYRKDL